MPQTERFASIQELFAWLRDTPTCAAAHRLIETGCANLQAKSVHYVIRCGV
jgi:hypothetical protein